jgi:preprotein translocase subunit SecE
VQSTTVVVVIAVFFFGLYFWLVDNAIGQVIDRMLRYFHH